MIRTEWFENTDFLEHAFSIRRAVFVEEQGIPEEGEFDEKDAQAIHVVVYDGRTPVATGRLFFSEGKGRIGRVAVLESHRKQKLGDLVVRMLVRRAFDEGYVKQELHAQVAVKGFYETIGFYPVEDEFTEDGIPHILMVHDGDVSGQCCT